MKNVNEINALARIIQRKTDQNFHTVAVLLLVKAFDFTQDLVAEVEAMWKEQQEVGWLTGDMNTRRYEILSEALRRVKAYSEIVHYRLYQCF